jgi:hypothetical protein
VIQRLLAGFATLVFAATVGGGPQPARLPASPYDASAVSCASATGVDTAWSRLAARLPAPTSCVRYQPAPGTFVLPVGGTVIERSSPAADVGSATDTGALDLAAVSGQNLTLIESGSLTPVVARCRLTVSPNPGALVLPNPRNGVVLLVCRNQPRP